MSAFFAHHFFRMLAWLPPSWLNALARPIGAMLSLAGRRKQVTLANLKACFPEQSDNERSQMMRRSNRHFARVVLETAWLWNWPMERMMGRIESVSGLGLVEAAQKDGRGIIFAAPHIGAWEVLGLYLQTIADMAIVFKTPKDPGFEPLLIRQRAKGGAAVLTGDAKGLRSLMKHLRAGGGAGILPDQQPKDGDGQFAPFFGVPALTGTLLPKLARRTNATVIFAVCERLPGAARYRVHFLPAEEAIVSDDTPLALAALNRGVEDCIRLAPDQWLWAYKRFRIQPPDAPPFYS